MKKILFILVSLSCSLSWADWKYGIDQNSKSCGLQVLGPARNVQSQRGLPLYDIDLSFEKKKYLGILAEIENGLPLPFESLLRKADSDSYTRVIGAAISPFGIGLRTVKGTLITNKNNEIIGVDAEVIGGVFGKKHFNCLL